MAKPQLVLSLIVPVYDEAVGLVEFHQSLAHKARIVSSDSYEIIYVDDGSKDESAEIIRKLHLSDARVRLLKLSRNFGKENALSAGIAEAKGEAIIMIDGDGQHPVELIPELVEKWRAGAQVVIGVRTSNSREGWFKRLGSKFFYKSFSRITGQTLVAGSTDYRLINRDVQRAFLQLRENDRMTRGLIDWLGFKREFVTFQANARQEGLPGYTKSQLVKLAANSFVSLSPKPLYMFGYLGMLITLGAFLLGTTVLIEQLLLGDPLSWNFTGTAMLGILILFLVGIVLLSQGILSLYISHIHTQSKQRPLYVIDYSDSAGLQENKHIK